MGALALTPDILNRPLSELTPEQLTALGLRRPATDAEAASYDQAHQAPGAPADFGGRVLPNPNGIQVSDDTDPGIPETKLDGATFQNQNFSGPTRVSLASTGDMKLPAGAVLETSDDDKDKGKGWLDREIPLSGYGNATLSGVQSIGRGLRDAAKGTYQTIAAPPADDTEKKVASAAGIGGLALYRTLKGAGHTAEDAMQIVGAIHDINASPDPTGTYLKVGQETAGQGAGQALLALGSEGVLKAAPKAVDTLTNPTKLTAPVRATARAVNKVLQKAPGTVGATVGGTIGAATKLPYATEIGAGLGSVVGKEILPELEIPGEHFGLPKRVTGGPKTIEAPASSPAGGSAAAESEDLEGVTSPQIEHAATSEPEMSPATQAPAAVTKASPATVEKALNEALGGKPLQRGVSLKNQGTVTPAPVSPGELPEGFTPVKSSALKGYKYDPEAKEFESITTSGQRYIHGDVSPEDAQAFEAADSKGKAWQQIRENPLVAKVLNGKRVPVQTATMGSESGQVIPKAAAGMQPLSPELAQKVSNLSDFIKPEKTTAKGPKATAAATPAAAAPEADLTSQLQKSLDAVQAGKGGVFTSAPPKMLLDRWGVDPESFAEGREQTRGMKPEESAAAIKKLTAAYKKGQAIEPVMETRDANNNLIEVDGRSRALAAHKAGIDRIPIIVRRLQ